MRILMLAQFYAPTVGGEERHVQDLSVALAARGHSVAVATLWGQGLSEFQIDQGVRIYRVRGMLQRAAWLFKETERRHVPPIPDPELMIALRRIVLRERPEIVHAHNWLLHSFLPLKAWSRAKLIVTLHDYSLACAKKRLMYRSVPCSGPALRKCLGCANEHYGAAKGTLTVLGNRATGAIERHAVDRFIAVSQAAAGGNGLIEGASNFQVIPNFVPDDLSAAQSNVEDYLTRLPPEGYLLFVGDVSTEKGIHVLLAAYAGLKNAPPLVLIGRLLPDTPTEFPAQVMVMNRWPHAAVMAAWRRSSIALVPSTWPEPFGIVAIEAMAAGRPVIASHIGGLPDIVIDGETGLLVPPGDSLALRQAMERLLADRDQRERMGQAAQRRVTEFHLGNVVPRIEQVYRQVLNATSVIDLDEPGDKAGYNKSVVSEVSHHN